MSEPEASFSIGQLARRTGVSVRTIRFWSDRGVIPATERTAAGYRRYDAPAVARLELVRTLRELGLGLDAVQRLLAQHTTVRAVAQAHVAALDATIRTLRLQRAVLRTVAQRGTTIEEITLMNTLAKLSAQERQRIVDDFVARAFAGIDADAPGAGIGQAMRQLPADLPDDPTAEQVDAWLELAELVQDESFQRRVREMAVAGAAAGPAAADGPPAPAPQLVAEQAGRAVAAGIAPDSAAGKAVLDAIVPADTPAAARVRLREQLETFTDARVERYWQLMGILNGRPPFPSVVPAMDWLRRALQAQA
jgi:DNA-binding transcriptional MerR regulator